MLVKHDGREDHIYGTGNDRKVITVGGGQLRRTSSDADTTKTSSHRVDVGQGAGDEKTKPVDGRAYADILTGSRKVLYLNTSGNVRDGKTFVLVKKDDREYHIYGTGKDREIFGREDPTADADRLDHRTRRRPTDTTTTGTTATGVARHQRHADLLRTRPPRTQGPAGSPPAVRALIGHEPRSTPARA